MRRPGVFIHLTRLTSLLTSSGVLMPCRRPPSSYSGVPISTSDPCCCDQRLMSASAFSMSLLGHREARPAISVTAQCMRDQRISSSGTGALNNWSKRWDSMEISLGGSTFGPSRASRGSRSSRIHRAWLFKRWRSTLGCCAASEMSSKISWMRQNDCGCVACRCML